MRRAILAALVAAVIAGPAAAERGVLTQQSQRDFDAAGVRTLRVENPRGLVEVRRSGDGRVHVHALKRVRAAESQRDRLARETVVETDRAGDVFEVRVRYAQGPALRISFLELFSGFETPRVDVQLAVEVPPGTVVEARSASGDLRTTDLTGIQRLATTSGDIRIEGAGGPLSASATSGNIEATAIGAARLRSVSGDLQVTRAGGALDLATTSGGITVHGATDSLRIESVSGDVEVDASPRLLSVGTTSGGVTARGVAGGVLASSSSGDVELHALHGLNHVQVTTGSGGVSLALPAAFGGTLDLATSSGTIDVGLPLKVRTVTRHELRGVLGTGVGRIELKSSSGDLHVTGGGNGS